MFDKGANSVMIKSDISAGKCTNLQSHLVDVDPKFELWSSKSDPNLDTMRHP